MHPYIGPLQAESNQPAKYGSAGRIMRSTAIVLLLFALALPAGAAETAAPLWIDVRSAEEFAAGHLTGAINIPHDELSVRIVEVTRDLEAPIHLYCGIGVRAQMAKLGLESRGYRNVTNEGGLADLKARLDAAPPDVAECGPARASSNDTTRRGSHHESEDC